jgi:outer membrane receptor protein involved in Fe transport
LNTKKYLLALPLLASTCAHGQDAPMTVVEVAVSRTEQRRQDTSVVLVIGRDELLRFSDPSLADALKRVPGITVGGVPGRAGELRMRGLGSGYTQVLLNGQPLPAGFSIESIAPDLVERVEVMRVARAEFGAQAIAGTINIVLRKSAGKSSRELKPTVSTSRGLPSAKLAGQMSGKTDALSYTVAATATENRTDYHYVDHESGSGAFEVAREGQRREQAVQRTLTLSPRLNLASGTDTHSWQGFMRVFKREDSNSRREQTTLGAPTRFPNNSSWFLADANNLRGDWHWTRAHDDGRRWELKAGAAGFWRQSDFGFVADHTVGARAVASRARERTLTLSGKLSQPVAGGHALVLGWDGASSDRTETRHEQSIFAGDPPGRGEEHYGAEQDRFAVFLQDDWSIGKAWSVSAGLRWETLSTSTSGNALAHIRHRSRLLSPLLQSLYKWSGSQFRIGVTRTYKAPTMIGLAQRRLTIDNGNSPVNPDSQGNPALVPERAWGLDLAYEHYLGKQGMLGVSAYARRIDDVIASRLFQQGTSWVNTVSNEGRADTWGLELEARLPLRTLWPSAPAIDVRANLVRNWSRVHRVAGPDNRLAGQVPSSANAGVDYQLSGVPVTLGLNAAFQAGGPVRLSDASAAWSSPARELELYGSWKLSARSKWQLTLANLLQQDKLTQARFEDASGALQMDTRSPTGATLRLTFSHTFGD